MGSGSDTSRGVSAAMGQQVLAAFKHQYQHGQPDRQVRQPFVTADTFPQQQGDAYSDATRIVDFHLKEHTILLS